MSSTGDPSTVAASSFKEKDGPPHLSRQGTKIGSGLARKSIFNVVKLGEAVYNSFSLRNKNNNNNNSNKRSQPSSFARQASIDNRSPEEKRKEAFIATKDSHNRFSTATINKVIHDMGADPKNGLTSAEAAARLEEHGKNELEKEEKKSFWKLVLDQFTDLLVLMLIVSALVSLGLGEYAASVVILLMVFLNAVLGVYQENKAGAALDALESLSSPIAEVLRDGQIKRIASTDIVPGDIILLAGGQSIPADVRLIESSTFSVNEMPLTGESEPVNKDAEFIGVAPSTTNNMNVINEEKAEEKKTEKAEGDKKEKKKEEALTEKNMSYMGCNCHEGRAKGVVVKTGMHTKMGEIAHLIATAEHGESPLSIKLHALGKRLGFASIAVSVIVFVVGVASGRGADTHGSSQPIWLQMLLVAISLTVAAVPEGLPACVTITLAVGMKRMVKKNALVRNLKSVETLGSASVICSDKTGTLTKGEMTCVRLWFNNKTYRFTGVGYDPKGIIIPVEISERDAESIKKEKNKLESGVDNHHLVSVIAAALCSNALLQYNNKDNKWECVGNISERPLIVAAAKAGIKTEPLNKKYKRLRENPFNSARKMMSTLVQITNDTTKDVGPHVWETGSALSCVKGAPNIVLTNCVSIGYSEGGEYKTRSLDDTEKNQILNIIDSFSEQAYRVLAIATRSFTMAEVSNPDTLPISEMESGLTLVGLVASIDPHREEVPPSILKAFRAGIRVVMITGDYVLTAKAIGKNIHLLPPDAGPEKAIDCAIIREIGTQVDDIEKLLNNTPPPSNKKELEDKRQESFNKLDAITAKADVYARAKPVDKITIVRSLQRQGHVCSMTGDGVNDAPALKQANIGVAMGVTGTDVAKGAADMILTDDNFCSIVEAVEEGRTIYANITKFVFYLLSTNVSEVFVILIGVLMGLPSPLLPIQILWLNMATDGAPAIALALEPIEPGIMEEGPRKLTEPLLDKLLLTGVVIQTIVATIVVLSAYIIGLYWHVGSWDGKLDNPSNFIDINEHIEIGVRKARSMAILLIVFSELMRSYGARSLRRSLWSLGPFKNNFLQYGVIVAISLTLFFAHCPGIRDKIFSMEILDGKSWGIIIGFSFIAITADEITKYIYRLINYAQRPKSFLPPHIHQLEQEIAHHHDNNINPDNNNINNNNDIPLTSFSKQQSKKFTKLDEENKNNQQNV